MKIDVGGVNIDAITKSEALERIKILIGDGQPHYIVTPYSEQIVFAHKDPDYLLALNSADLSVPDGIGILWAAKFLSLPGIVRPLIKSLFAIILNPKYIRTVIPEQITGRNLVYDLSKISQEANYSISLVGGDGNVAAQAAYKLKELFPNLRIKLALSGRPFNDETVREIASSNSDILLIAYSPPMQEKWIARNLINLNVKLAIGLGGTFDYLAEKRPTAPKFVHYMGLEWLWRLITQPWRALRIWNAVPVFIFKIIKYKIHASRSKS